MALDPTKPITGAAAAATRRARQLAAKNAVAERVAAAEAAARAAGGSAGSGLGVPASVAQGWQMPAQVAQQAQQVGQVARDAIPLGPVGSTGSAIPLGPAVPAAAEVAAPSAIAQSAAAAIPAEAAPVAETAAATGVKGLLTRTPFLTGARALPAAEGATGFTGLFAAGSKLGPGSIGRAGLYGVGGQVAGNLFDSIVGQRDGTIDDAASSALRWGGAGAGIGSMIAPGIGTAIGGVGGAVIGGLKGYFTGHDSAATETMRYLHGKDGQSGVVAQLAKSMDGLGIDATTKAQFGQQFNFLAGQAKTKEEAQKVVDLATQALPSIAEQSRLAREQQTAIDEENARVASRAAAIQTMMQQQLDRATLSAQQGYDSMSTAATGIRDPVLRATYQTHAANLLNSSRQQGLSWLSQIAMSPQFNQQSQQVSPYDSAYQRALGTAQGKLAATPQQQSQSPFGYNG